MHRSDAPVLGYSSSTTGYSVGCGSKVLSFGSSTFLKSSRNKGLNQSCRACYIPGGVSHDLYDFRSRFTTNSELKCVSPGIPVSLLYHRRLWVLVSSSGAGKSDVERDRLLRYSGSGEGGNVRWRLAAREGFLDEVLLLRFTSTSLAEVVRSLLTSRGISEGPAVGTIENDLRFLGGLGGVERGEEIVEEGGEERWDGQVVLLLRCGAGRLARRVVTTTGDVVDVPDLETLDGEKKLRSEDDLVLGDDNIAVLSPQANYLRACLVTE